MNLFQTFGFLGAFFAMLAVILGAFGSHFLKDIVDQSAIEIFRIGVLYQFFHSFGLIILALLSKSNVKKHLLQRAGYAFVFGILIFSGSLYALVLSGIGSFGMVTPLGGMSFIFGWIILSFYFLQHKD